MPRTSPLSRPPILETTSSPESEKTHNTPKANELTNSMIPFMCFALNDLVEKVTNLVSLTSSQLKSDVSTLTATVSRHESDLGRLSSDSSSAVSRLSTLEGNIQRLKQIQEAEQSQDETRRISIEKVWTRVSSVEESVRCLGATLRDEMKSLSATVDVQSRHISELETKEREHEQFSTQVNQHQTEIVNILQKNTQMEHRLNQLS
jgi:chromosome segregation ATPase